MTLTDHEPEQYQLEPTSETVQVVQEGIFQWDPASGNMNFDWMDHTDYTEINLSPLTLLNPKDEGLTKDVYEASHHICDLVIPNGQ